MPNDNHSGHSEYFGSEFDYSEEPDGSPATAINSSADRSSYYSPVKASSRRDNLYDQRRRSTVLAASNRGDFSTLELELSETRHMWEIKEQQRKKGMAPWCFPVSLIAIVTLLILIIPFNDSYDPSKMPKVRFRDDECIMSLVESLPSVLNYTDANGNQIPAPHASTYDTWMQLINMTESSLDVASFYWTLRSSDFSPNDSTSWQGDNIYNSLYRLGQNSSISLRIAANAKSATYPQNDTIDLQKAGVARVRYLNFTRFLGTGILHTKLWISDKRHFYVGSANSDWRSLTQVKELGLAAYNCPTLAEDIWKIFQVYWILGQSDIPKKWPSGLSTQINVQTPLQVAVNYTSFSAPPDENNFVNASSESLLSNAFTPGNTSFYQPAIFIASSPPPLSPAGRTQDIDALVRVINSARQYICIAVMDYAPAILFDSVHGRSYWPIIDDALRNRIYSDAISVRLLVSRWKYTAPNMVNFMNSLLAINGSGRGSVQVRYFEMPGAQTQTIPYTRVNHNKYVVTDTCAYVSTSNWSGDYFTSTGGVSVVVNETRIAQPLVTTYDDELTVNIMLAVKNTFSNDSQTLRAQLFGIFERDWYSNYSSTSFNIKH